MTPQNVIQLHVHTTHVLYASNRPLSRRLDRCDRVIQDESGDSNGGNV